MNGRQVNGRHAVRERALKPSVLPLLAVPSFFFSLSSSFNPATYTNTHTPSLFFLGLLLGSILLYFFFFFYLGFLPFPFFPSIPNVYYAGLTSLET